jgi:hypothetical protein
MCNNKTEFPTTLSKSYRCAKEQSFGLTRVGSNETVGTIKLSHVQLEAFHKKMDGSFGTGWCSRIHLIHWLNNAMFSY